jgi:hypothetical protein
MLMTADVTNPPSPLNSLPPPVATTRRNVLHSSQMGSVLYSLQIKPAVPNSFDGDRARGHTFITSCELYLLLTGSDSLDDQTCMHWTLFHFKSGYAATFAGKARDKEW